MRAKKAYRKNANEEKENTDKNYRGQYENSPTKFQDNCNMTYSPLFVGTQEEKQKDSNFENISLSMQKSKSTKKQMDDNSTLSDISNKNNGVDLSLEDTNTTISVSTSLDSEVSPGQKRPFEESSNSIENERLHHLETTWMPCSEHLSMVQNTFNDILQVIHQDNVASNSDDKILNAIQTLNIDPNILLKLKKETSTATARTILKYKFPNPPVNFRLAHVDKALADAIVLYSKRSHPNGSSTVSNIRRAMSNYFALITYKKKLKLMFSNTDVQEQ